MKNKLFASVKKICKEKNSDRLMATVLNKQKFNL